jgi:type IV pilus assembly protein PilA
MPIIFPPLERLITLRDEPGSARQKGLTLIEVMIVVAIMGLVLAGALPAYEESLVRAKIAEGLSLAGPYQELVRHNAVAGRALNANVPGLPSSSPVRSISIADDGVITVTYKSEGFGVSRAANLGGDPTVMLIPMVNGSTLLKERATVTPNSNGLPAKAVVEWSCATASSTITLGPRGTLPSQFAPADCR